MRVAGRECEASGALTLVASSAELAAKIAENLHRHSRGLKKFPAFSPRIALNLWAAQVVAKCECVDDLSWLPRSMFDQLQVANLAIAGLNGDQPRRMAADTLRINAFALIPN